MKRGTRIALFAAGAAMFGYLVARIGIGQLASDAVQTGWMFLPIVGLYALVYGCSALAWQRTMVTTQERPSFWRTYAMMISAGAINFLTPVVNAGGEPFRIAAAAPWLGKRRAAGSVILHRMLNSLAYVLVWLTAVILAFFLLPSDTAPIIYVLLATAAVVLLGVIALFLFAHRRGLLERLLDGLHRVPLIRRIAARIEPHRTVLIELDNQIVDFYHRHPRRFFQAVALEYLGRCIFMIELMLIAVSLGLKLGYLRAFAIGGLEALLGNVLFFVPFELGSREGAFYVLFNLFGLDPQFGLYTSIVSRVRDFSWIGVGLLLIWATDSRHPRAASTTPAVPQP
jgi:uncharacterized protein (TIRG00374 family)